MLVINQGVSGKFHIFRGDPAALFLEGLDATSWQPVVIRFQADYHCPGLVLITRAGTATLAIDPESISDFEARRALRAAIQAVNQRLGGDDATA